MATKMIGMPFLPITQEENKQGLSAQAAKRMVALAPLMPIVDIQSRFKVGKQKKDKSKLKRGSSYFNKKK